MFVQSGRFLIGVAQIVRGTFEFVGSFRLPRFKTVGALQFRHRRLLVPLRALIGRGRPVINQGLST